MRSCDSLGLLEFKEGKPSLTLKQGSYDRLYYSIYSELAANPYYAATEKITWSGSGGVTVKNGVVYAKKVPKNGKTAKVTLKCVKSKIELPVTVK
ncbi:MAG: hypothetical protein K6F35_10370 [Lachnospiraceae bacterium]|nr:hypothetical protein [Lachnospiraceae bacterium]